MAATIEPTHPAHPAPTVPGHTPVMVDEVVTLLAPPLGGRVIDATVNGGGHARALLERLGPEGRLLGLDRDPSVLAELRRTAAEEVNRGRLLLVTASFARIAEVALAEGLPPADAVLFDLGISSYHLESSGRGFSFEREEPLDLRFDVSDPNLPSAAELLRRLPTDELARIFHTYGEERYARRIARHIGRARARHPLRTAVDLRDCVLDALPGPARRYGRRSVARVFQALRIVANAELDAVEHALPQVPRLLRPGGRVAVLSFHSLEDRIVKGFFRSAARGGELIVVTKKPLRPGAAEVARNPRARSARLRVAERV